MARFLKFLLLFILFAAIIVGSLFFYYKRQLNYLPDWYSAAPPTAPKSGSVRLDKAPQGSLFKSDFHSVPGSARKEARRASGAAIGKSKKGVDLQHFNVHQESDTPSLALETRLEDAGSAFIKQEQLMPLLLQTLAAEGDEKMATAIKAAKTTIHPGTMTMEMIVDVDKIPNEELDALGEKTALWLQSILHKTGLNEMYVKADIHPIVQGQDILLLPQSKLTIGKISFSLSDLQKRFDIPDKIAMERFIFTDFELLEGKVLLKK